MNSKLVIEMCPESWLHAPALSRHRSFEAFSRARVGSWKKSVVC